MDYIYYDEYGIIKMISEKKLEVSRLSEFKKKLTKKNKDDVLNPKKAKKIKDNKLIIE